MSNNVKRATRARMKKHDETYSTARRHVLAGRARDIEAEEAKPKRRRLVDLDSTQETL